MGIDIRLNKIISHEVFSAGADQPDLVQSFAQNIQLHYDLRHTVDPAANPRNFPTLYFEYFKAQDSGRAFIKPGAFLFKMQADLLGSGNNIGKMYMQVAYPSSTARERDAASA